ncbi:MAG: PfkB family carbohydrate kinase, partial [Granulosicoccaceae bacterium]
ASETEMCDTITEFAELSQTVLASFDDERDCFGDECPEDTLARYRKAGCSEVVVKNGAQPLLLWAEDELSQVVPQRVEQVVDSTAAGDSFNGAYVVKRLCGEGAEQAAVVASALAAAVVQRPGALAADAVAQLGS